MPVCAARPVVTVFARSRISVMMRLISLALFAIITPLLILIQMDSASASVGQAPQQCLVGTWHLDTWKSVLTTGESGIGLGGTVLTITPNGVQKINWNSSTPIHWTGAGVTETETLRGTASGPLYQSPHGSISRTLTYPSSSGTESLTYWYEGAITYGNTVQCAQNQLVLKSQSPSADPYVTVIYSRAGSATSSPKAPVASTPSSSSKTGVVVGSLLGVLAVIVIAGFSWFWIRRRRKRPPPVPAAPPDQENGPECDCSGYIAIDGPDRLRVCECSHPHWQFRDLDIEDLDPTRRGWWAGLSPAERAPRQEIYKVLEAVAEIQDDAPVNERAVAGTPRVMFARSYSAEPVWECIGGGKVTNVHVKWDLLAGKRFKAREGVKRPVWLQELTITVTATGMVTCPDSPARPISVSDTKTVLVSTDRCKVSIIVNRVTTSYETGHAGVRIQCGEFDRIYGYYPNAETFDTLTGIPGHVQSKRNDGAEPLGDDAVNDLGTYYPDATRWVFTVVPKSCHACRGVQDYWDRLTLNSGEYNLFNNNCAIQALRSVQSAGLFSGVDSAVSPDGLTDELTQYSANPENGVTAVTLPPGITLSPGADF